MWTCSSNLFEVALRTAIIYFFIFAALRLMGKREVGQMTLLDLLLILLLSNSVQNAMTGPDSSLIGGLTAAITLLLINILITRITYRSRKFSKIIEGSPVMLVHSGSILDANLENEKISREELLQALREHGIADFSEVHIAVLEIDGTISIVKRDELPSTDRPRGHIRLGKRSE